VCYESIGCTNEWETPSGTSKPRKPTRLDRTICSVGNFLHGGAEIAHIEHRLDTHTLHPTRKQCRKRRTAMDRLAMPVTGLLL